MRRVTQVIGDENGVTAIAAATACEQVAAGQIKAPGAWVGPQVIDAAAFVASLPDHGAGYHVAVDDCH